MLESRMEELERQIRSKNNMDIEMTVRMESLESALKASEGPLRRVPEAVLFLELNLLRAKFLLIFYDFHSRISC